MEARKLSYIHSFKCGDVVENFDKLPDETQKNIEIYIAKAIYESFVEPADEDYLTARFLAQNGLHRAFFWAAAQPLEKYLKAFLLMRGGVSVNRKGLRGHPIVDLYREAVKEDHQLREIDTKPHPKIEIHSNVADTFNDMTVDEFLDDIQSQGSPDNRYNSFGVNYKTTLLFALDSFAFGLRSKIGVPAIGKSFRKMNQELIRVFYVYNPWFSFDEANLKILPNSDFI